MRARVFVVGASALLLAACGYVGDPLPPALNIPTAVSDFKGVQRGDSLVFDFTAPALTTEALAISEFSGVELRVGPVPPEFSMHTWAASAMLVPADADPGQPVHVETTAAPWHGKEVLAAVRFAGPKGRLSEWSNAVTIHVSPPLAPPPDVKTEPHPAGIRVFWTATPGVSYRVYKQSGEHPEPLLAGTVQSGEFIDRDTKLGAEYSYRVQGVSGNVESERSPAITAVARDLFPPAAPGALTAVAGVGSVELTWERNTEADLRGYRVYRAAGSGEFERIADAVEDPAYSDRQVAAGTAYRYAVSSVDTAGNESTRSADVRITAP